MSLMEEADMATYTLQYWQDGPWLVGRLKEYPGVFSQGKDMTELEVNIREAYHLMVEEQEPLPPQAQAKEIRL
jgi:predicted RNase H-like HicB family nuclease